MSEIVNRRDLEFLLFEFLDFDSLAAKDRFQSYDRSAVGDILDTAEAIANDFFLPIAAKLDANEPQFEDGKAITIPEVGDALAAYADAGFFAGGFDEEFGGLQMPNLLRFAVIGIFSAANTAVAGYPMLTTAAANMLARFGSEEQIARFLQPMLSGQWFGTMCLSEPQAGSSLADIKTLARPLDDGSWSISGSKMWISGGEQEISENIVHMVLAKTPDAAPGVKGISLFIVPKLRVDENGVPGEKNNIVLAGLNHKMGQRGITNTLLNFGEGGDTIGYMIGEEGRGLAYMFHMMNEARLSIGHCATTLGLAGYLHSLEYARNRPQGRKPGERDASSAPLMIIEHADVKRLLLAQKAAVEGALALILYCARVLDEMETTDDEQASNELNLLLELLTPIAKSWPAEFCLEANKHAIQILGGYGYTRDYPVERFYRDNRLNPIHEGTHGIQGLDLLGRKVRLSAGKALELLGARIARSIEKSAATEFAAEGEALAAAFEKLVETTTTVLRYPDIDRQLANATLYLDGAGHIVIAWMWLEQALLADGGTRTGSRDAAFYAGKQRTARYFFEYELPKALHNLNVVANLGATTLEVSAEELAV